MDASGLPDYSGATAAEFHRFVRLNPKGAWSVLPVVKVVDTGSNLNRWGLDVKETL